MIPRFGANPRRSRPRPLTGPAPPCTLPGSPGARPGRHWPGRGGGGGWGGEAACPGGIPGNRPSSRRPHPWASARSRLASRGVRALVAHAPSAIWSPRSSARLCVPRVLHTDGKRSVEGPRGKAAGS